MASTPGAQKPGQDATKGPAPKMPFGRGQVSKKSIGGKGRKFGRRR